MSKEFFSQFPAEHLAAMGTAPPGAQVSTDMFGTRVTLPRTFEPSPFLTDKSPKNLILRDSPFSKVYFSTYANPQTKVVLQRAVVVCIDGACINNGTPGAKAGLGVFFGPDSPHNISERIEGEQTSQRAEILAAIRALEATHQAVASDFKIGQIVLVSDSSYVVSAMTDWVSTWKENGWKNSSGGNVVNKDDFKILDDLIDDLKYEQGLDTEFWKVGREDNKDADGLASAACQ